MKVALAFLALCGLILSTNAACSSSACTDSGNTCENINTYLTCLNKEKAKCTSADVTDNIAIGGVISAKQVEKTALGCGACAVTVSATALALSMIAVYMKM